MKYLFLLFLLVFLIACSSTVEVVENISVPDVKNDTPIVSNEKTLKDLSIEIMTNTAYPEKGENFEVKVIVKNEGFKSINTSLNFQVSLDNYSYSKKIPVVLFPATNFIAHEFNFTLNSYGTYVISSKIDVNNELKELDEDNNEDSLTIYVKEPKIEVPEEPDSIVSEENLTSFDGCSDTDDGKDYSVLGTCTDLSFPNGRADFCTDDSSLAELYCASKRCQIEIKSCNNICSEGVCL